MLHRLLASALGILVLALPQGAAAAPTWLASKNLSVSGNGGDLSVAADAAGDAFALWTRSGTVQAAERPAGGAWSAAQDVSGTCVAAQAVHLAASPAGAAVAVWECPKGGHTIVQASAHARGGSWGPPQDLSAAGRDAHVPRVALDRAGAALAVWTRSGTASRCGRAPMAPARSSRQPRARPPAPGARLNRCRPPDIRSARRWGSIPPGRPSPSGPRMPRTRGWRPPSVGRAATGLPRRRSRAPEPTPCSPRSTSIREGMRSLRG